MKQPLPSRRFVVAATSRLLLLSASLLTPALLRAQATPPPPPPAEEEIEELSPFVVNDSSDVGYAARNTLAGTRFNAELKNLPSQISVMTKELLNDLSAASPEDAYKYSLNVEGLDEYQSEGSGNYPGNLSVTSTGRIRSIGVPSKTQNFFPTAILLDSYNTDRITFSSGPNAVIYGIGAPGGIVNTDYVRANVRRRFGEAQIRVDDQGGLRTSLAYNLPLAQDLLAVRFAILDSNEDYPHGPGYDETRRYFGTVELRPTKYTTLYAYAEKAEIDRTPPRGSVIYDAVTPWLNAGRPLFNNGLVNTSPVPNESNNLALRDPLFTLNDSSFRGDRRTYVINDPAVPFTNLGDNESRASGGLLTNPATHYSVVTVGPENILPITDRFPYAVPDDGSVADLRLNIRGDASRLVQDADVFGAVLDQRILKDLYISLGYNREVSSIYVNDMFAGSDYTLRADANMYLPYDRTQLNPNAGRLYIEGIGRSTWEENSLDTVRAQVSYQVDFTRHSQWFGRHSLSALWSRTHNTNSIATYDLNAVPAGETFNQVFPFYNANPQYLGGINGPLTLFYQTAFRYYLDESDIQNGNEAGVVDIDFNTLHGGVLPNGATVYSMLDNPYGPSFPPPVRDSFEEGEMILLQSHFFRDRLVFTGGWRRTEFTQAAANLPVLPTDSTDPNARPPFYTIDQYDIDSLPDTTSSGEQTTYGVVVRPLSWLGLYYNKSDTWGPPTGKHNPDNSLVPASFGEGEDYGVMLSAFDQKVSLRVNFFHNTDGPSAVAALQPQIVWDVWFAERAIVNRHGNQVRNNNPTSLLSS